MDARENEAHIGSVGLVFFCSPAGYYDLSARTGLAVAARREARRSHKQRAEAVKSAEPVRRWCCCGLVDIKSIARNPQTQPRGYVPEMLLGFEAHAICLR
jgi:hypothetical protein